MFASGDPMHAGWTRVATVQKSLKFRGHGAGREQGTLHRVSPIIPRSGWGITVGNPYTATWELYGSGPTPIPVVVLVFLGAFPSGNRLWSQCANE